MKKGIIALFVSVLFLAIALSGCVQRSYCGNDVCETMGVPPETPANCPADCGPAPECIKEGNTGIEGEDECCEGLSEISNCSGDETMCGCGPGFICTYCGNGECGLGENVCNCSADCEPAETHLECVNQQCVKVQGAGIDKCESNVDCLSAVCGNGVCDANENFENCSQDCYPSEERVEGSLSVGTTKPVFSVGEKIELKPASSSGESSAVSGGAGKGAIVSGEKIREFTYLKDGKKIVFLVPETDETVSYVITDVETLPKLVSSSGQTIYPASIEVEPGKKRYIVELKGKNLVDYAIETLGKQKVLDEKYSSQLRSLLLQFKPSIDLIQSNAINSIKNTLGKETVLESRFLSDETKLVIRNKFKYVMNAIVLDLTEEEVKKIEANPFVSAVFESKPVYATLPDAVKEIKADTAWNVASAASPTTTGKGVSIGIIDTGIDYSHADLGGCLGASCKVKGGYDFINDDNNPMDDYGHGTHVASIAAGNGLLLGVAPDADLYGIKVLDAYGSGSWDTVIAGIEWAIDPNKDSDFSDHLDVINLSLGGWGNPDDNVSKAIDKAVDAGIVAVVAAGNSGPYAETIGSPGTARKAITVGAECRAEQSDVSQCDGRIANFSSRGPVRWTDKDGIPQEIMKPDVIAPGVLVCAARYDKLFEEGQHPLYKPCIDDEHVLLSGTSMASPVVAGATALMLENNPSLNPLQVKQLLKDTAIDLGLEENAQGAGLVDVFAAIGKQPVIIAEPSFILFQSDVLSATTIAEKQFELKNNSASTKTFQLSLNSDQKKLSTLFSQQTITLSPSESKNITATFTVNNLEAASGEVLKAEIVVKESGSIVGKIPVRIKLKDRIAVSIKSITAVDVPSNQSYYKEFTITVQNLMSDTAQQFAASIGEWKLLGIEDFASLEPKQLTVPAGSTADLDLTINIPNNSSVPNGIYEGKIFLDSKMQKNEISFELIKKFVLEMKMDYKPGYMMVFDSGDESVHFLSDESETDENHYVYYSDYAGEKSVVVHFWRYTAQYVFETRLVVKENLLPLFGAPYNISVFDAKNRVFFNYVDSNGNRFYNVNHERYLGKRGNRWFNASESCGGDCVGDIYAKLFISDIDSSWVFFNALRQENNETGELYQFIKTTEGAVNADYEFSVNTDDYKKNFVYPNRKGLETLAFYSIYFDAGGWGTGYYSFPFKRIARYFVNANELENELMGFRMDLIRSLDGWEYAIAPLNFYYGNKIYSKAAPFGGGETLEPYDYHKTFFGFPPFYWSGRFANWNGQIIMHTNYTDTWNALFLSQAHDRFDLENAAFRLYNANHEFIREDRIYSSRVGWSPFDINFDVPVFGQKYFLEGEMPYEIDGKTYNSKIAAYMDLGASDRNPPYFKSLQVLRNGNISSYAEKGTEIEFEAVDELSNVSFEATVNGMPSTILSRGNKKYLIMGEPVSGLYEIAIKARDATGNFIEYSFQVPEYVFLSDKSRITNNGSINLEGWLEIKIIKPDGSEEIVVDKPVSIASSETRDISQYFNAKNVSFTEPGEYEVRARLQRYDRCVRTPARIMFLATQVFEVK
jgi:subtilisin family serine protease